MGGENLAGVVGCDNWAGSRSDGSCNFNRSSSHLSNRSLDMVDREVGGGHTETHGVRDVVNSLYETVGVNVAVASPGDAVGGLNLLLGLGGVRESVVVLADVILSMELRVGAVHSCGSYNRSSSISSHWSSSIGSHWSSSIGSHWSSSIGSHWSSSSSHNSLGVW